MAEIHLEGGPLDGTVYDHGFPDDFPFPGPIVLVIDRPGGSPAAYRPSLLGRERDGRPVYVFDPEDRTEFWPALDALPPAPR